MDFGPSYLYLPNTSPWSVEPGYLKKNRDHSLDKFGVILVSAPSGKLIQQWNVPRFDRKYISNPGPFSIAMLDYRSVTKDLFDIIEFAACFTVIMPEILFSYRCYRLNTRLTKQLLLWQPVKIYIVKMFKSLQCHCFVSPWKDAHYLQTSVITPSSVWSRSKIRRKLIHPQKNTHQLSKPRALHYNHSKTEVFLGQVTKPFVSQLNLFHDLFQEIVKPKNETCSFQSQSNTF